MSGGIPWDGGSKPTAGSWAFGLVAPAVGLEPTTRRLTERQINAQSEALRDVASVEGPKDAEYKPACFTVRHGDSSESSRKSVQSTAIETAPADPLERALLLAAEAGRFDVVAQLARELEARRLDAAGVVKIDTAKRKT
jgi:hypothetical protein